MKERIISLIDEFVLSWTNDDKLRKESVQCVLDGVRNELDLDCVYVMKSSEMYRYEFKVAFISCSDEKYNIYGCKHILNSADYNRILCSYGKDNLRIVPASGYEESNLSRTMEYGFIEEDVSFGLTGFYTEKPHIWSENEIFCLKKLGRAMRIYIDSIRRRSAGYNRTQDYVSALTYNSVFSFYLDVKENSFTALRKPYDGIPESGNWDDMLKVFTEKIISQAYTDETRRKFLCQNLSGAMHSFNDRISYTFMSDCSGFEKWYTITAVLVDKSEDGTAHHVIITVDDVTESVEKEENNRLAFQLLHNTYVRISFIDLNKDYIYDMKRITDEGDEVAESLNSYCESIRKCSERYVREEDSQMFREMLSADNLRYQLKADKGNVTFTYSRKINNTYKWVKSELIPVYDYSEEKSHLLWYVTNISEEKAREESYKRRQSALNSELIEQMKTIQAFCSIYFAAWIINADDDTIVSVIEPDHLTDVAATGETENAFAVLSELFRTDDANEKLRDFLNAGRLAEFLENNNSDSVECRGNDMEWYRITVIPFNRYPDGKVKSMIMAVQDISKDKAAELEAQEKLFAAYESARRANTAKSGFLSRMSHDIRTPINGIIGLLEIAENHPDDTVLLAENRKKEKVAARHLLSLVNDVLDMSKLEDGNYTLEHVPFNMLELYNDTVTMTELKAAEAGITFVHDSGKNITSPEVIGSPLHVRQVLLNILVNAVKYNVKYGKLIYTSDIAGYDGNTVSYRFRISDTGNGMSEEFQRHIFEPFTQEHSNARSKYQGTGLGMAIVKKLTDMMNGTISLESKLGKGTVFTITLPFEINHNPVLSEASDNEASVSGMKILIAEDNELNLDIVKYMLCDAGAEVDEARNGKEAVDKYLKSDPGTYDAILMDIMMPVMDGIAASKMIRTSDKADAAAIPIIALTANAFAEDTEKSRKAGMNAHLAKPYDIKKLISTLSKFR